MHYYVDGYNLLFRVFLDEGDLKTQRQHIIQEFNSKIEITKIDVSLVFDASFRSGEASISHFNDLEILFTAAGESADDFIIDCLQVSRSKKEVVVTSDKKLAWRARSLGAITQPVEEFLTWLNKVYKNKLKHPNKEKKAVVKEVAVAAKPPVVGELEYYLHAFEKRFEILVEHEKNLRKKKKSNKA